MSDGLSTALAARVSASRRDGLPPEVSLASRQFLLNSLGTVIAGSTRPVVGRITAAGRRVGARATYCVPARAERLDMLWCATATGAAGHVDDFDDTHPVTYIHAGPTLTATCLTLGQHVQVSGRQLLQAMALGYEVQLRAALAISPEQYVAGWHSTGVFGVIGAAAASCVLLGLDEVTTSSAIALAANFTLGHQEGLGTMNKSFHAGKAAANGIFAAMAAHNGARPACTDDPLEELLATIAIGYEPRLNIVNADGGWRMLDNRIKPFPCGIVAHPGVEAALRASADIRAALDSVSRVVVHCGSLAATLTGIAEPTSELNTRLSLRHGVAAALVHGVAGLSQFDAASIAQPEISRLRSRVELVAEPERSEYSAAIRIELSDGATIEREVPSVVGGPENPMSDAAIALKFRDLVEPVLPGVSDELRKVIDDLDRDGSICDLYRLTCVETSGGRS
jgi:2-methylcitrate dehydratase PrpD